MDGTETKYVDCISGEVKVKMDARLNRSLTLGEFITAFGRYKSIMCEAYAFRRQELDLYERDIIDMAHRFGGTTFYEYHKAFSAKAAAYLTHRNIKLDWSVRDNKLYTSLFAGHKVLSCELCKSMLHATGFCPLQADEKKRNNVARSNYLGSPQTDAQGRPRVKYQGRELCNNYNAPTGCQRKSCHFQHLCNVCFATHPAPQCQSKSPVGNSTNSTPNNVSSSKVQQK